MRWLVVAWLVLGLRLAHGLHRPFAKVQGTHRYATPLRSSAASSEVSLGGKIVVSGLNGGGQSTEDEFMLNLLNEQSIWSSVVLATPEESSVAQKRFLTRTARYSGLLNILEFAKVDVSATAGDEQLGAVLANANAWLAFNVTQSMVPRLSQQALAAGVKRFVVTVTLPADKVKETAIPEFDAAVADFAKAGASFTGIRHGAIIEGDENKPYEIYNATIPCLEDTVEQGVLARVTAELLLIPGAANSQCGVSSSSAFAQAYLNILRSSGLTRRQEVTKIFEGGLQKVAQLTVAEYEAEAKRKEVRKAAAEERREQEEKEEALTKARAAQEAMNALPASSSGGIKKVTRIDPDASITPHWDEDQEPTPPTDEEKIVARTDEILKGVWREFETRMYAKSTSKGEFYDTNRATARELAEKELAEAKATELSLLVSFLLLLFLLLPLLFLFLLLFFFFFFFFFSIFFSIFFSFFFFFFFFFFFSFFCLVMSFLSHPNPSQPISTQLNSTQLNYRTKKQQSSKCLTASWT